MGEDFTPGGLYSSRFRLLSSLVNLNPNLNPNLRLNLQLNHLNPPQPTSTHLNPPQSTSIHLNPPHQIRSGATVEGTFPDGTDMTIQALEIDTLPEASAGIITDLATAASAGATTVDVEVGASKFKSMGPVKGPGGGPPSGGGGTSTAPPKFSDMTISGSKKVPVIVEGTYGSQGSEMLFLQSAAVHPDFSAWSGSAGDYNVGDKVCHCKCGVGEGRGGVGWGENQVK